MPEVKVSPSDANDDDSTHHHQETEDESFEPVAQEDDHRVSAEMKHSRKKALLEFRCRVEDAILSNYILGKSEGKYLSRANGKPKENLRDISLWGVPLLPSKGHEGTDVILLKFLKAKDFKASEAFNMLRKTLKWRREIKFEGILEENFGSDLQNMGHINGTDKVGHPLCYTIYGAVKDKEIYKKRFGTEEKCEEFLRWKVQFMEKCIKKLSFKSGGADSIVQIIDLKNTPGPAMKEIRWISKKLVVLLQENYPGLIFRNIIINVPLWFLAFHALHLRYIAQRTKSKFIYVRPSKVTETLLKFIVPENIPIQYGGLRKENDDEFSPHDRVLERNVKVGASESIQIPVTEAGMTVVWDMTVIGYEVSYREEFVPDDDCSYKVLLSKEKKMGGSVRNSFHIREPGKIVITLENGTFKKKKVFYRYKIKQTVYIFSK